MRIVRLAQLFEFKYNLKSEAAFDVQKFNDVKQAVIDAYNNYINPDKAVPAYNIVPLMVSINEPHSIRLTKLMESMVNGIDSIDPESLFDKVNAVLALITDLQKDKNKVVRNSIHDIFPLRRETDKNRREQAKSKFENVVFKKLASILEKLGKTLSTMSGMNGPLAGASSEPQVKEPSKQDVQMFRISPPAVKHRLDDPEVFAKVWADQDIKRKLIYLINSAKRSDSTYNSPEIMAETDLIMAEFARKRTNEGFFEGTEEQAQEQMQAVPAEEAWNREMQIAKQEKALEDEEAYKEQFNQTKTDALVKKRDEEHAKRQQEQMEADRDRLIRSEGSSRLERILKRYK